MKNTLSDLNNYLFEQIERLTDDDLDDTALEKEIKRSTAIQKVANTIIANGNLALRAQARIDEVGEDRHVHMPLLGLTDAKGD